LFGIVTAIGLELDDQVQRNPERPVLKAVAIAMVVQSLKEARHGS
jgi:hypothetical protein